MKEWESNFNLTRRSIQKSVVWLRMPGLPLEYWVSTSILAIAEEAGRPLSIDDFTNLMKKTGYAQVRIEIDAGKPLKPGILIRE